MLLNVQSVFSIPAGGSEVRADNVGKEERRYVRYELA
jgi:hypothetical protein